MLKSLRRLSFSRVYFFPVTSLTSSRHLYRRQSQLPPLVRTTASNLKNKYPAQSECTKTCKECMKRDDNDHHRVHPPSLIGRADRKSWDRQCLNFCKPDFWSLLAHESAEQKTQTLPNFRLPLSSAHRPPRPIRRRQTALIARGFYPRRSRYFCCWQQQS